MDKNDDPICIALQKQMPQRVAILARRLQPDPLFEELLLAGQKVPAGRYRQLGTGRLVSVEREDSLPASLDARVACYVRVHDTWTQQAGKHGKMA